MSTTKTKKPRMLFGAFLRKYGRILIGGTILVVVFFFVIFADYFDMGYDPAYFNPDMSEASMKPNAQHLMGTDQYGRDIWSRILHGGQPTLIVAIGAQLLLVIMGTVIGLLCGYYNKIERVVMRILEAFATIPNLLLTMLVLSLFRFSSEKSLIENVLPMIFSMSIHGVPGLARMIRNQVLSLREKEYIESEKAMGASDARTIFVHILPACFSYLLVRFSNGLAGMILSMASLSFLGLGLPTTIPTWGFMVNESQEIFFSVDHFYIFMWPTLVISITVFGFAMLGDGLRDLLDPRLK